jgi:DNA polymerase elongation subunit (family B)
MTGEGLDDKDLVISKLLRQDIEKYKSLFPHVYAAIQLSKHPLKGDTIQYINTDSQHKNPLCRVVPIENIKAESLPQYDKEKYKEMTLDAAETVLGFFALIGLLTAISRGITGEGNGGGMKNSENKEQET